MSFKAALINVALVILVCSFFPSLVHISNMSSDRMTVRDFGYDFNSDGQLRQIDKETNELTDNGFVFAISDKHLDNQKHYEALGEAITEYVYQLLETRAGLRRVPLPTGGKDDLRSFIFVSDDFYTNKNKMMVLIHGSGVVRGGQWARSLIINDGIESGTQLSYIQKAKELGYSVIVLNTNDNQRIVNGRQFLIPQSSTPEEHANTVYEEFIKKSPAEFITVVAHSYGGVVTVGLAQKYSDFIKKVSAIAMTDSVHSFQREGVSAKVEGALKKIGRNWVSSHDPLDTPQKSPAYEIPRLSAGHPKHEMTSHSAFSSVFQFFEDEYQKKLKK